MYHALQTTCLALICLFGSGGCNQLVPQPGQVFTQKFREIPVQPLSVEIAGEQSSSVEQILALPSGGFVLSLYENKGAVSHNRVIRLNADSKLVDEWSLGTDRPVKFVLAGEKTLAYAIDRTRLESDGTLRSMVEVWQVSLETRRQSVLWWNAFEFEQGYSQATGWLPKEAVKEARLQRQGIYEAFAVDGSNYQSAAVLDLESKRVYLDHFLETLLCSFETNSQISVQPLTLDPVNKGVGANRFQPIEGAPGHFATSIRRAELSDAVADADLPQEVLDAPEDTYFLVLAKVGNGVLSDFRFLALRNPATYLRAGKFLDGKFYFGGTSYGTSNTAWIGVYDGQTLKERTLSLPGMSSVSAIEPTENGRFVVAGICDYNQVKSGSMSNTSGFVVEMDEALRAGDAVVLRGKRSTHVSSILVQGQTIYLGGFTDGPDTHAADRSNKGFFLKVISHSVKPREYQ